MAGGNRGNKSHNKLKLKVSDSCLSLVFIDDFIRESVIARSQQISSAETNARLTSATSASKLLVYGSENWNVLLVDYNGYNEWLFIS